MKGLDIVSFEYKFKQLFANLPLARHAFMTIISSANAFVCYYYEIRLSLVFFLKNNLFPT